MEFIIHTLNELEEIAKEISQKFCYKLILLEGEMGAGKTTFAKELVKILGSDDEVSSPTYSIVNEYDAHSGKIYHFDFYRLQDENEALDLGIEEYLFSDQYCLMEWSNKIANFIPKEHHIITIQNINGVRYLNFR